MISICIPVFNYDIGTLITEISRQIQTLNNNVEIIVIEDGSKKHQRTNRETCKNYTYIELPENVGRAKIRNLFLKPTKHEYLLFLDCDSLLIDSNFLSNYLDTLKNKPSIVCGGRIYPDKCPANNQRLSWKYGKFRESKPAHIRKLSPNKSFMTNNFLIHRELLDEVKFDERLTQYGHEDTLFGFELSKRNISITHIENPVLNGEIETNEIFLSKTEKAIQNLVKIEEYTKNDTEFIQDNKLLCTYQKIKNIKIFIQFLFTVVKPFIRLLLVNGIVNLNLFNFYKLGLFISSKK